MADEPRTAAGDSPRARLADIIGDDQASESLESAPDPLSGLQHIIHRNFRFVTKPSPEDLDNKLNLSNPLHRPNGSVRIAVAALQFDKSEFSDHWEKSREGDPQPFHLFRLKDTVAQEAKGDLEAIVQMAVDAEASHLFLSELGYPVPFEATTVPELDKARSAIANGIIGMLGDFPKERWPFIFAGSFHNPVTLQNEVPIFSPHLELGKAPVHLKKTSAVRTEEQIRVPANRALRIYRAGGMNIGLLVCLDAYDASQALAAVTHNVRADVGQNTNNPGIERIDILAVISFAMAKSLLDLKKFEKALLQLGESLGCAVVHAHASTSRRDVGCCILGHRLEAHDVYDQGRVKFAWYELTHDDYFRGIADYRIKSRAWSHLFVKPATSAGPPDWEFVPENPTK